MPYVHFDTHRNVRNLKETTAIEKFLKEFPPQPGCIPEMKVDDVIWTDLDEKTEGGINRKIQEINWRIGEKAEEKINKKTNEKFKESPTGVIEKDLYGSLPLNCRKTLSEFYYGTMPQAPKQIVTRHFKEFWPDEDPLALMVDQLWMLVLFDGKWYSSIVTSIDTQLWLPRNDNHIFSVPTVWYAKGVSIHIHRYCGRIIGSSPKKT